MGEQGGAILTWLEKSDRFLRTGRQALTGGDYETAVSRAYYAVFHAVHALLGERQVIGSHVELIRRCVSGIEHTLGLMLLARWEANIGICDARSSVFTGGGTRPTTNCR